MHDLLISLHETRRRFLFLLPSYGQITVDQINESLWKLGLFDILTWKFRPTYMYGGKWICKKNSYVIIWSSCTFGFSRGPICDMTSERVFTTYFSSWHLSCPDTDLPHYKNLQRCYTLKKKGFVQVRNCLVATICHLPHLKMQSYNSKKYCWMNR